ncbi:organic cation transporter protein-like [Ylistrum balloti]|uniref:organic cation transporter protein-like n=1 Tax=Ylistrum balloti TaxID=509963 RepID=UPI0029059CED|nr:organic cation transporter protein-like [Ylistrum balloti]
MDFDEITKKLGEFGRYQKFLYLLVCLTAAIVGLFAVMGGIILASPEHRCKIPGLENDTFEIQNDAHQELISNYIPPSTDKLLTYDKCHLYSFNSSSVTFDNSSQPINATLIKCTSWVYSYDVFDETVTSKFDVMCDNAYQASITKSLFYAGVFVGAFVFGQMSDFFGRKKTFYLSVVLMLASSLGLAFAPNYIGFSIINLIVGAASQGLFLTGFVIGVELVGPSKRIWAGIVIEYAFAIGLVSLSFVGYFVRYWQYLVIICALPFALNLSYWWLLPESPRWLISKKRFEEAEAVLRKAERINKVKLPDNLFDKDIDEVPKPTGNFLQLFTNRILLIRTLIIFFNWTVVTMIYYGLSLNSGNLGGNFYLNFFLSGLVEFPGYTVVLLFLDRIGRKRLHCICMIVGGTTCLSTIFTILFGGKELQALTTTLAMIGKLGAAAAFAIIYIYSAELFPTVVRNSALGASSCVGRIGNIAAPYIADAGNMIGGRFGKAFPLIFFGATAIIAGCLSLFLPETLNEDLPETIEDGILFGTDAYKNRKRDISMDEKVMRPEQMTKLLPHDRETKWTN